VEGGQVEIEFNRPWDPTPVPDEPFDLRLNNFPASGIAPYLILKFDLNNGEEIFGRFQVSLRIKVMKEVWVSDAPISRGDLVTPYVLKKESLDVLRMRDFLDMEFTEDTPDLVAVQGIAKGSPLTSRLLKERPLVKRGDLVEAWVQTGKITVNMKAEALENGINGQLIRLRNPVTKRYLRGKVTGEQMVIIPL